MRRYILWGWFVGGGAGAFAGFYGLLMLLAKLQPDMPYEEGLSYLLFGAGIGVLVGGFTLSRFLSRRGNL